MPCNAIVCDAMQCHLTALLGTEGEGGLACLGEGGWLGNSWVNKVRPQACAHGSCYHMFLQAIPQIPNNHCRLHACSGTGVSTSLPFCRDPPLRPPPVLASPTPPTPPPTHQLWPCPAAGVFELNEVHSSTVGLFISNDANPTCLSNKIWRCNTGVLISDDGRGDLRNNEIYANHGVALELIGVAVVGTRGAAGHMRACGRWRGNNPKTLRSYGTGIAVDWTDDPGVARGVPNVRG